jgi:hypothetical protein
MAADPQDTRLRALAALVVKEHVRLGGLPRGALDLSLALVWAGLPAGVVMDEPAVNDVLKAQLAGPANFLDTDHVELRRWLVDAGWLVRDGFGREYRRVAQPALAAELRELAGALEGLKISDWVRSERERKAEERARKRLAWAARSEGAT